MDQKRIKAVEERYQNAADSIGGTGEVADFKLPSGWYLPGGKSGALRHDLGEGYGFSTLKKQLGSDEWEIVNPKETRQFARARLSRTKSLEGVKRLDQVAFMLANFQEDANLFQGNPARGWLPARNMSTLKHTKLIQQQAKDKLVVKGTQMVFDVETAGLSTQSGLRQVSAHMVDAEGNMVGEAINFHMKNQMMNLGLSEFMDKKLNKFSPMLEGAEAEQKLKGFFQMASQQDVLTGQNVSFDINQLTAAAKRTELFKTDTEFQGFVESFIKKAQTGKVIDTQAHARILLGKINLAPELRRAKKFTKFSLENVVLQTSFIDDLVKEGEFGPVDTKEGLARATKAAEQKLVGGLHDSSVDVYLTHHFRRMLTRAYAGHDVLRVDPRTKANEPIEELGFLMDRGIRHKIASEAAIVPNAKYGVAKFVNVLDEVDGYVPPDVLARMHAVGGKSKKITALEASIIRNQQLDIDTAETSILDYGKNRKMLDIGPDRRSLSELSPMFADWESGIPKTAEWRESQRLAAHAGLPFAGLSFQERVMSESLSRATGGSDLISNFSINPKAGIITEGRLAHIPFGAVEGYGGLKERIARGDQMLDYSLFSHWDQGKPDLPPLRAAGIYLREGIESDKMMAHLRSLPEAQWAEYGLADTAHIEAYLKDLEPILKAGRGVQIGVAEAAYDDPAMSTMHQIFEEVAGSNVDEDITKPMFQVAAMDADSESGVLRTGPVIYRRGLEAEADGGLPQVARAMNRLRDISTLSRGDPMDSVAKGTGGWGEKWGDEILKATKKYIEPHMNWKTTGVAAAVGAGGLLLHKHNKANKATYNDVLAPQGYEESDFYQQYKEDLNEPYKPQYRASNAPIPSFESNGSSNPLATAGTVRQLDQGKINHTNMSNKKNNHLYGGSL